MSPTRTNLPANRLLKLKRRPSGDALPSDFEVVEAPVDQPKAGEVLVRVLYSSVDAALRLIMHDSPDFLFRVAPGDLIRSQGIGEVIESQAAGFKPGDLVLGGLGVQDYSVVSAEGLERCDPSRAPLSSWLGGFGVSGLTAYFGLLDVCKPKPGETLVVTGAAGAVGSIVGQIGRIKGARAIGLCGSDEKCRWLKETLGYDVALNYKKADFYDQLVAATPDRVHMIFDNVGGPVFDQSIRRLSMHARAAICGATSQYNSEVMQGPSNYIAFATWRSKLEGFVVYDYADRFEAARRDMTQWIKEGRLKLIDHIVDGGPGDFPKLLQGLYQGTNRGKMILRYPGAPR